MTSIFDLAKFLIERADRAGNAGDPQTFLDKAAKQVVEGYLTLDEASEEEGTRFDAWGNEIEPSVVWEAVRYLKAREASPHPGPRS